MTNKKSEPLNHQTDKEFLPRDTVLYGKYMIGNVLFDNSEGTTYFAYDIVNEKNVNVKEYFPSELSKRTKNSLDIEIVKGNEINFKVLKSDFIELCAVRVELQSLHSFQKAYEYFFENNTVYLVCENIEGINLKKYLSQSNKKLNWHDAKALFYPMMEDLQILHSKNIVHKGISLKTVFITHHDGLKLSGFSINPTRTVKTGLEPELFDGYTAPEQYLETSQSGVFNDVYSIAAVMYTMMGGHVLNTNPDSKKKTIDFEIPRVPQNVCLALQKAMMPYQSRFAMIGEFIKALEDSNYHFITAKSNQQSDDQTDRKKLMFKVSIVTGASLLLVVFIIILSIFIPRWFSSPQELPDQSDFFLPESNLSSNTQQKETFCVVPDFRKKNYDEIKNNTELNSMFDFQVSYAYHESVSDGRIISQGIVAGEKVKQNSTVEIVVSKGNQYPVIPSYDNISPNDYKAILEGLGLTVNLVPDVTTNVSNGTIVAVEPGVGTQVDVTANRAVKVYYADHQEVEPPIPYE